MKIYFSYLFLILFVSDGLLISTAFEEKYSNKLTTRRYYRENVETTINLPPFLKNVKKSYLDSKATLNPIFYETESSDEIYEEILLEDNSTTTTFENNPTTTDVIPDIITTTLWSSTSTTFEPPTSTLLTTRSIITISSTMEIVPTNPPPSSIPIVTTTSPVPYIPCQSWISFSYDDSQKVANFSNQMAFISSAIGEINHPERLQFSGIYNGLIPWNNNSFSIQEIQNLLNLKQQQNFNYNLSKVFSTLEFGLNVIENTTKPIGAIIFISDTSDAVLYGADQFKAQLSKIHLTFVLLGPDADQNKLTNYSTNFIYWSDMDQYEPDNWDSAYLNAYGCEDNIATSPPPEATTNASQIDNSPYIPCQSWISFSYDDSYSLTNNDSIAQMDFIANIIGSTNHPERIQAIGLYTQPVSWKSGKSIDQIQNAVYDAPLRNGTYSLRTQFAALITSLETFPNNTVPIGALIFISNTSNDALSGADQFKAQLSNIHLTFVLLGPDVDQNKLTNFSSNFIFWRNMNQALPENWDAAYLNAYGCANEVSPTPVATTTTIPIPLPPNTTTTTTPETTTAQAGIKETPPPPILNCNNDILQAACQGNITVDTPSANISQIFIDTQTKITNKIKNDNFTSEDVHDVGSLLYNITSTVKNLTTAAVHSAVDIVSVILNQPIKNLEEADNQTNGAMLWFIASIPQIVDLSDSDINITRENLQLHSQSLNEFCELKDSSSTAAKELCQETENGKFCATFDPKQLCGTGAEKAYLALWKNLAFYIVSNNANKDGIKLGSDSNTEAQNMVEEEKNNSTYPYKFPSDEDCKSGTYPQTVGANSGNTGGNNEIQEFSTKLIVDRKRDQNDLHVKVKTGVFIGGVFTIQDTVTRGKDNYETICITSNATGNVMCTLILEGNSSDPVTCTPILRWIEIFFGAIGVVVTLFGFIAYIIHRRGIPIHVRFFRLLFDILLDKSLSSKARKFAFAYNIIFTLYIIYLTVFSYKKSTAGNWVCTASAVVGYLLYLCGIFLTIIMLFVTLKELGNWRPTFQVSLDFMTGFEKTYVPFIYGFGIPLIMTFFFAATITEFFKRNDGYCWIRPDYSIPALWIPLTLLILSWPFYVPLIARQWPTFCCANFINRLCCCCGGTAQADNVEAAENLSIALGEQNITTPSIEEIRSNYIISRLIVPQVFLGIPLIAENFTLYYAKLTGYHYAFILTLAAHLIILYSVSVYLSYKTAMPPPSPPEQKPIVEEEEEPNPSSSSSKRETHSSNDSKLQHSSSNGNATNNIQKVDENEINENIKRVVEMQFQSMIKNTLKPKTYEKPKSDDDPVIMETTRRPTIHVNTASNSSNESSSSENESDDEKGVNSDAKKERPFSSLSNGIRIKKFSKIKKYEENKIENKKEKTFETKKNVEKQENGDIKTKNIDNFTEKGFDFSAEIQKIHALLLAENLNQFYISQETQTLESDDANNANTEISIDALLDKVLPLSRIQDTQTSKNDGFKIKNKNLEKEENKESKFVNINEFQAKIGDETDYENNDGEIFSNESETEEENMSATETSQISTNGFESFSHPSFDNFSQPSTSAGCNKNEKNGKEDYYETESSSGTINFDDEDILSEGSSSSSSSNPFEESENDFEKNFYDEENSENDDYCDFSDMEEENSEQNNVNSIEVEKYSKIKILK